MLCNSIFLTKIQLIYNIVLVSGLKHSNFLIDYYKILSIVPLLYSRSLLVFYFISTQKKYAESVSPSVMSNCFATPWTVVHQAPLSMGFSRQDYWSGQPFSSPGQIENTATDIKFCFSMKIEKYMQLSFKILYF